MAEEFDVFLAHNSLDKPLVRIIAEDLKKCSIRPWIDEDQILPGQSFQDVIQQIIPEVKSAAIFIGRAGLGRWQRSEMKALISQCQYRGIPVIPVLLHGITKIPSYAVFLEEYKFVEFKHGVDDKLALLELARGITQDKAFKKDSWFFHDFDAIAQNSNLSIEILRSNIDSLQTLRSKKSFTFQQLVESIYGFEEHMKMLEAELIDDFGSYIRTLKYQKDSVENEVGKIEATIKQIESVISEEIEDKLRDVIDWLEIEQKQISRYVGESVISRREAFGGNKLNDDVLIYWTLEKFVEIVRHYLMTDDDEFLFFVEKLSVSSNYINSTFEGVEGIRNRIRMKKLPEEVSKKIDFALDGIISCLEFIKDNQID